MIKDLYPEYRKTFQNSVEGKYTTKLLKMGKKYDQILHHRRYMKVKVKLLSRVRLFVTPMDCSLPGSSVYVIFWARILEWVANHPLLQGIFPTQGSTPIYCIAGRFFTIWATREASTPTIWPSNSTPRYLPKRNKNYI